MLKALSKKLSPPFSSDETMMYLVGSVERVDGGQQLGSLHDVVEHGESSIAATRLSEEHPASSTTSENEDQFMQLKNSMRLSAFSPLSGLNVAVWLPSTPKQKPCLPSVSRRRSQ